MDNLNQVLALWDSRQPAATTSEEKHARITLEWNTVVDIVPAQRIAAKAVNAEPTR
jgi:hypothetical protein